MARPGADFKDRLLDALLEIDAFKRPENRDFLLRHLPRGPVAAIARYSAQMADLGGIVDAAEGMGQLLESGEWALVVVARDASRFAKGTQTQKTLEVLLGELETNLSKVEVPPVPEIIVGSDERLPIAFLEKGIVASTAVAKVLVRRVLGKVPQEGSGALVSGTGWLITPDLFLTNHHVIEARYKGEAQAKDDDFQGQSALSTAWFGYLDENGPHWDYLCAQLVSASRRFDYALLRLNKEPGAVAGPRQEERPLSDWGFLSVVRFQPELSKGYRLNIIQHSQGGPKQVAIRSNFYFDYVSTKDQPNRIRYLTDTEPGASGSPVFDDRWQVVALHHASVRVPEDAVYRGDVVKYNNQGIAIHAILNDLPGTVQHEIKNVQGWS
jgi:Trypsin-like peptidase domain